MFNFKLTNMKTIRKISQNRYLIAFLILSFLNISCSNDSVTTNVDTGLSGEEMFKEIILFSGKDLDKKIPQYQEILDQLKSLTPEQNAEFNNFKAEIVSNIKRIDPNFFNEFKNAILTKNLYTIDDMLSKSGDMVMASLSISKKYNVAYKEANKVLEDMKTANVKNQSDLNKFENQTKEKLTKSISALKQIYNDNNSHTGSGYEQNAVAIVLVLAVAVVLLLAGAVTHAVAAVIAAVWGGVITKTAVADPLSTSNNSQLKNELIVLSIIDNYSGK